MRQPLGTTTRPACNARAKGEGQCCDHKTAVIRMLNDGRAMPAAAWKTKLTRTANAWANIRIGQASCQQCRTPSACLLPCPSGLVQQQRQQQPRLMPRTGETALAHNSPPLPTMHPAGHLKVSSRAHAQAATCSDMCERTHHPTRDPAPAARSLAPLPQLLAVYFGCCRPAERQCAAGRCVGGTGMHFCHQRPHPHQNHAAVAAVC